VMDRAYPYMDLNAKYGKLLLIILRCLRQSIQILQNEASAREIATCKQDFMHSNFQMDKRHVSLIYVCIDTIT
jgi:hypothetical protein